MPTAHTHMLTPRVRNGEPQPAPTQTPEPASAKRDLTSWWRTFSKRPPKKEDEKEAALPGIFGVPLIQSIPYANVAISLFNEHGESYIYGYVPIVVAKCGVYLKEKATDVEGIFRLAGSEKRIKELKTAFDTPPRYGKGLDWTGYTVHDAANILRRYFNNLPEPIIPLGNYDPFRQPLRGHQAEAVGAIEGQSPSVGGFDPNAVVRVYQHLIKGLPSLNRQLLLYILDLLAVFAAKADINKMTTHNLAAIFQPGILSHPQHDMSPQDYRLSQDVLIFLIDNQDHFLIGMEGTAVDEGTVKHIESGPSSPQVRSPTTPGRNNSAIGRSASTSSSAGAESLRKYGGVRRNVSTSSKRSRHSGAVPSPITPAFVTPTASGVHRSNTLPSKRSPGLGSPRFPRERSGPATPAAEEAKTPTPSPIAAEAAAIVANLGPPPKRASIVPKAATPAPTTLAPATEAPTAAPPATNPIAEVPESAFTKRAQTLPPGRIDLPPNETLATIFQERSAAVTPAINLIPGAFPLPSPGIIPPSEDVTPTGTVQPTSALASAPGLRSPHLTPTREKAEYIEAPVDSDAVGEPTPATRTFTQILSNSAASPLSAAKEGRKPNKLQKKRAPASGNPSAHSSTHSLTGADIGVGMTHMPPSQHSPLHPPQPPFAQGYLQAGGSKEALHTSNTDSGSSRNSGTTLKPSMSPSTSFRSHSTATEYSEAEPNEEVKDEKRNFWKAHKRGESRATPTASQVDLHGSVPGGDKSMSSFGSSSGWGGSRRSLQYDSHQNSDLSTAYGSPPDSEKHEKKGAFEWFHKMRQDHKGRGDKRDRAKSPPGSSGLLPAPHNLRAQDNSTSMPTGTSSHVPSAHAQYHAPPAAISSGTRQENSPTNTAGAAPGPQSTIVAATPFQPITNDANPHPHDTPPQLQTSASTTSDNRTFPRPATPVQAAQPPSTSAASDVSAVPSSSQPPAAAHPAP